MSDTAEVPNRANWLQTVGLGTKELRAWAMYDWANSAFATTIIAALLPLYYKGVAASELTDSVASGYWAFTGAIALAIVAVVSPVLGAIADYMGVKKRFLLVFMGFGATFTALLYFVGEGDWLLASAIFIVANVGFAGANVFYEALLPSVARGNDFDRVSTAGYALGYVGGGVLLALNAVWFLFPETFGFTDGNHAVRASFVSAGIWWALFSIPLFRTVREPDPRLSEREVVGLNPVRVGFFRVAATLKEIRGHPDLFLFLLAFLVYNDGVATIIRMATSVGSDLGIEDAQMISALVMVQFLGIPFTLAFGYFAARVSAKSAIFVCLVVYSAIATLSFFMSLAWHFWALAVAVAMVQGGIGGLSRSLYASMIPAGRSTEFFGFYSVSSKFGAIIGPLVFGAATLRMEESRWGLLALVVFFVVGAALLTRVNVGAGQKLAREVDSAMRVTGIQG